MATKKKPDCPACGSQNNYISASTRRQCKDCGKSFPIDGKYRKPPIPPAPVEQCPKCQAAASPRRRGSGNGRHKATCRSCGYSWTLGHNSIAKPEPIDGDVFVVTCAVNDTPVHAPFLRAVESYAAKRNARIVIIPIRYKNPTSQQETAKPVSYAKSVMPYLVETRLQPCKGLQILADIKTQPTAAQPLASMDGLTGTDSCIVGHPRLALEPVATRGHELPKLMLTTGAVTRPNYSRTVAGSRGEFNHVHGAVVVEVNRKTGRYHLRHINATSAGSFIDLDTEYLPDGTTRAAGRPLALVLGDVHAELHDPAAIASTREQIAALNPRRVVLHDVHNHGSASHHLTVWERFARRVTGKDRVAEELKTTAGMIDSFYRPGQETVVVSSNHHDHLGKWLADHRNGDDMTNAGLYHKAKASVLAAIEKAGTIPDIFALVIRPTLKHPARFLTERDSYQVGGVELAYHGDKGPNGSRGSAKSLNKIGVKSIIGHSHSPRIVGGCYQAGTLSLLDMGYNAGPSSWMHGNVVVYSSGKRTHLHIIDGEWRT